MRKTTYLKPRRLCSAVRSVWAPLALCILGGSGFPAWATDVEAGPVREPEAAALPAITVTAQKREQSSLEVPASVSVIAAEELRTRNVHSLEEAVQSVPGVVVDRAGGGIPRVFIRGVGDWNDQQNKRVAVLVDGVPQSQAYLQDPLLAGSIARIELLKGPQGTLYGRGAVGGVINLVSQRPRDASSWVSAGVGSDGAREATVAFNRTLSEGGPTLGLDLRSVRNDGWLHNDASGEQWGETDRRYARLRLDARLGDVDALWSVFGSNDKTPPMRAFYLDPATGRPVRLVRENSGVLAARPLADWHIDHDFKGDTRTRAHGSSLDLRWKALGADWRSTTSWSASKLTQRNDADGSAVPTLWFNHDPYTLDQEYFYQELHASTTIGRTLLQGGVSGSIETSRTDYAFDMAGYQFSQANRYRTDSLALFGQADHALSDHWMLITGLRVQADRYRFKDVQLQSPQQSGTDRAIDYRLGLQWLQSDALVSWAAISTAHTPGGINTIPATGSGGYNGGYTGYDAERMRSLEWGIKGEGRTWRYGLTLYRSLLDDQQSYNVLSSQFVNIGHTRHQGVELEGSVRFARNWRVDGAFSLDRSRILESLNSASVGKQVGGVPPRSARLALAYEHPLAGGRLEAGAALRWQSERWGDDANTLRLPSVTLLDARVRWTVGDAWLGITGTNLTNRRYYSQASAASAFAPGFGQAAWAAPRTIWLQAGWQFR